jgi:IrrE N-terminal-like domain
MKQYRGNDGKERIWFKPSEIEQIAAAELAKSGLGPTDASPVVDLEAFVERHLKATLDQYADLGPTVLGLTEFFNGKPPRISINKDLTGTALDEDESAPGQLGRWRATLAHEAGHVLLHRSLFEFAVGNLDLFEPAQQDDGSGRLQRCLKRDATYAAGGDWREVQANQAMAALLMPKNFFTRIARAELKTLFPDRDQVPSGAEGRVAAALATRFHVSRQAARIRLSTVGLLEILGQSNL